MNSDEFINYVREQLRGLGKVEIRRMFGGCGVYCRDLFFAIIDDDVLYFKTSGATRQRYLNADCQCFKPTPTMTLTTYFEVPADVLESREEMAEWALEAIDVAGAADKSKGRSAKSRKKKATEKKAKQKRSKAR
ncbi:MAG: TfoX/Sxy family protein [Phycisphaeraceae bacterium]